MHWEEGYLKATHWLSRHPTHYKKGEVILSLEQEALSKENLKAVVDALVAIGGTN
jgi:hypothetical protein